MSDTTVLAPNAPARPDTDSPKRREVIEGARRVFFDKGFDGASMDEVARAAGVSKATIYAHFSSKDELFEALVLSERNRSAEHLFEVDPAVQDIDGVLRHIGVSFMKMMVRPDHIRLIRMVIGVAEKFPRIGFSFFDAGPNHGGRRLGELLREETARGRVDLQGEDAVEVAHLFLNMCNGNFVKAMMFTGAPPPAVEDIEAVVDRAVRVFLASYGRAA
ncbi:TetR/AcrR family transcriptional regulator [Ancylobacter sp. SL191]|uniref:TetR/AcrR family transcriptional regulator n=1 Tax=Ancylobacter sp. SL191 TaxID=2995166 RepID=UPI00226DD0B7|nr:TetR/AcrR family transcriptional regulator [Ancylobacter sp. SL191]WAC25864.1 TetR/AcrR family transcriptional regulator [Ancylobacter sp. SL191]